MVPLLFVMFNFLVVIGVIMIIVNEIYNDKPVQTSRVPIADGVVAHHGVEVRKATAATYKNDTAFVFLALGPQTVQMNCPAAVESLVKYAGWGGDVYFITDRKSCFDPKVCKATDTFVAFYSL